MNTKTNRSQSQIQYILTCGEHFDLSVKKLQNLWEQLQTASISEVQQQSRAPIEALELLQKLKCKPVHFLYEITQDTSNGESNYLTAGLCVDQYGNII